MPEPCYVSEQEYETAMVSPSTTALALLKSPAENSVPVVLSIVAVLIMLWLLQRQAAVKVSSLFFLTPALSTIEGAALFGERLGVLAVVGLAVALVGVALTTRTN